MKSRLLLFLLFVVAGQLAQAQNYRCIQPDSIHYFTNASFYLRGMRIDSVHTDGSDMLYYPYKSPRGGIYPNLVFDTTGGSWLGSRIRVMPDGEHHFKNAGGDTIVVRSAAIVGDNWVFFNDTSNVDYLATVAAMAYEEIVPGTWDSVKTISLQMRSAGLNISSWRNNYELRLSKNHGLVQAFDLWNFPYGSHPINADVNDYYLSRNDATNSGIALFKKVANVERRWREIYNWQPGDLLQSTIDEGFAYSTSILDSVIARTDTAGQLAYTLHRIVKQFSFPPPMYQPTLHVNSSIITLSIPGPDSLIFNPRKLPEEWYNQYFYYYEPGQQQPCKQGDLFTRTFSHIAPNGMHVTLGGCPEQEVFRINRGRELHEYCGSFYTSTVKHKMTYSRISGEPCGAKNTVTVPQTVLAKGDITCHPRPAHGKLYLNSSSNKITSSLSTINGRLLLQHTWSGSATLDVSGIAPGLYLLKHVSDGAVMAERVVIQ